MGTMTLLPTSVRERLRWFSLKPVDQSTAEGRARERHRRVALTAAAAALAKLLAVGSALISVPLTLHYLGAERFGMWMTISSLIAMLAFADFGIANGVLNSVASAHGRDDQPAIRRAVSSGFFLLSGVALALVLLFAAAYTFVPWSAVFNVQSELAKAEAGPALAVFVLCFAGNVPLAVVQRTQMGLQQGFIASLWQCAGSACGLFGMLIAIAFEANLVWLVAAVAGAPLLAALINSVTFFFKYRRDLCPSLAFVTASSCRAVARTGALFFVLQVVVAVAYTSDSILIAQLLGAAAVADYAIPEKLFALISMGVALVLAPLWPAYGEAISRGDHVWIRRTLVRSLTLAIGISALASASLLLAAPTLIKHWVASAITPAPYLLLSLAIWKVVEAGGNAVAMFLNGAGVIGLQVAVAVSTAIFALALKLVLIPGLGVAGAVWATVIAYMAIAAIAYAIFIPRLLGGPKS